MRDAVEKLVGDAVSECLLDGGLRVEFLRSTRRAIVLSSAEFIGGERSEAFLSHGEFSQTAQRQIPAMKTWRQKAAPIFGCRSNARSIAA